MGTNSNADTPTDESVGSSAKAVCGNGDPSIRYPESVKNSSSYQVPFPPYPAPRLYDLDSEKDFPSPFLDATFTKIPVKHSEKGHLLYNRMKIQRPKEGLRYSDKFKSAAVVPESQQGGVGKKSGWRQTFREGDQDRGAVTIK